MPGELILVNPRRKRRALTAKQKKYFAPRRTHAAANPKRKRRTHARRNPRPRRSTYRVRRNPILSGLRSRLSSSSIPGFINGTLLPAAVGAGGAVALDLAWQYVPLPDTLKEGPIAPITRIGLSVGLGFIAGAIGGRRFGEQVAGGALVVTLADLAKGYLQTIMPAPTPAAVTPSKAAAYVGAYVGANDADTVGWYSPAQASYG